GAVTGAAIAGCALTTHLTHREVVRLGRDFGLPADDIWAVTRKELPVPTSWLLLRGELLGILGNTLLSENYRSRQLEETSLRLALGPVIEAAVGNARPAAHAKGIRLELVIPASEAIIAGDPVRLQQIVSNLLVNAVKFTASGGKVEVRLELRGLEVQIAVQDT